MAFQKKRKRRKRRGYRNAIQPLTTVLSKYGVKREIREHRILSHWNKIVGDRIAAKTFPDGLEKGVLWVRVTTSAWLHELSFIKDTIVQKANAEIGANRVTEVRLHLGERRSRTDDPLAPTIKIRRIVSRKRELPTPASGHVLQGIQDEVDAVEDEDLRQAILNARRKICL